MIIALLKKIKYLIASLLIIYFYTCSQPETLIKNKSELDRILDEHVSNGSYPFLYAHIENLEGEILYQHSSVNNEIFPGLEVNKDTWIRIWSMSKIVTISIAMDLVEDNVITLNDPVSDYIPEFSNLKVAQSQNGLSISRYANADFVSNPDISDKSKACPITLVETDSVMRVMHLVNHTAGFYYANTRIPCLDSISYKADIPSALDTEDLIKTLSNMPLIQHPGERYHYGLNTTVLGLVTERATGKTLEELVKERISIPLRIKNFQYKLPKNKNLIPAVTGRDGFLRKAKIGELDIMGKNVPQYNNDRLLFLGGEGMLATTDSYADFLRVLLNNGKLNNHRFLKEKTMKKILSSVRKKDENGTDTGFGLYITGPKIKKNGKGDSDLWQGGGYESTSFWVDPKRKFVGLLITQVNQSPDHIGLGSGVYDKFREVLYRSFFNDNK